MDAPVKPGGTRKTRLGRDLIGRIVTFPPIEFLKKHIPLPRRRRKPKLGFDQPPQEIRKLALPLRPAPPSLSMRLYFRVRPAIAWLSTRCAGALAGVRHLGSVAAGHAGRLADRVRQAAWPLYARAGRAGHAVISRVAAVGQTRAGRAVVGGVERIAARVDAISRPATWEASQTVALMRRAVRVRRVLVGAVVCEWTAALGLVVILSTLLSRGGGWDVRAVNACGAILAGLSLAGLVLHTWHSRLVDAWRRLELFICGSCGGLRNFSPSLACPACGTSAQPVFPGQIPAAWLNGQAMVHPLAVAGPSLLASAVLFGSRLF